MVRAGWGAGPEGIIPPMTRWWWLVVVLGLAACAQTGGPATPTAVLRAMPTPTRVEAAGPLATPVIIASPTPSPTPFLHTIARGETLLGIALRYGISLEALQQANPGVNPTFLSVGQGLIIPLDPAQPAAQAAGAPTPAPVSFDAPRCWPSRTGALMCLVLARNPGPGALENVSARLTLADAAGLPVAEVVAQAVVDVIGPGVSVPLVGQAAVAPAGVAAIGVTPLTALPLADPQTRAVALTLTGATAEASGLSWTVSGQVSNPTTTPAARARVVLVLWDAANQVVGVRAVEWAPGPGAGEARAFTVTATSLEAPAAGYTLIVEGHP